MKGAAIPVSIRQVEAAYPHLNPPGHWLGLHESDFLATKRDFVLSYPPAGYTLKHSGVRARG